MTRIAILGGGSWGTALAIVLSRSHQPHEISLWMRDPQLAAATNKSRENNLYLPTCHLPATVEITADIPTALRHANIVVGAMPAAHAREIYARVLQLAPISEFIFVSATKGLELSTHLRMSEVLAQLFAAKANAAMQPPRIAVLSGPSFALEAARADPTAVVVASSQENCATSIQQEFAGPAFRIYTNDDVLGVELAGAMKNVIAIAAGACQGLGLGTNAIAALITRGLAEMSRLAFALGAKPETLSGLAGLGDLVLTCTGTLSRNRQLGIELAKGRKLQEILAATRTVAEGVGTSAALLALAAAHHIELPITTQVDAILHHNKSPHAAIAAIMERPQTRER